MSETNASLWAHSAPSVSHPRLAGDLDVDVAVVGGGVAGLTTALLLQRDGARVAVLEGSRVAGGTTGWSTAKVTALHGSLYQQIERAHGAQGAATYAAANQGGLELVRELVATLGIDCDWSEQSAYTYATDVANAATVDAEYEAARRAGLPVARTTETALPWPVAAAVRLDGQAQFDPVRYVQALARAVVEGGGSVFEHTRAHDVDGDAVLADGGRVRAEHVVVCTLLPFLDRGGYFAKAHPERSYVVGARVAEHVSGMYLSVDSPTRSVRSAYGGEWLVLGGASHKTGQAGRTGDYYDDLEGWARERFTVQELGFRWAAQDYLPVDHVPYVGRMARGGERLWVATGFQKWGFTNSASAARIISDGIAGRDNPWAGLFDARRRDVVASASEFVKENANVAGRLVGDRMANLLPPSAERLAPGEAGIVRQDGETVAAYRDEAGALHAVSPACTHMGCLVSFNDAERTWDCPCHGSRFGLDGRVLQGPATDPLEHKDTEA